MQLYKSFFSSLTTERIDKLKFYYTTVQEIVIITTKIETIYKSGPKKIQFHNQIITRTVHTFTTDIF